MTRFNSALNAQIPSPDMISGMCLAAAARIFFVINWYFCYMAACRFIFCDTDKGMLLYGLCWCLLCQSVCNLMVAQVQANSPSRPT